LVETEFGYHIIRLTDVRTPDLTAAKDRIVAQLQRQKAAAAFRAQAEKLNDLVYQQANSLKPAADALGLQVASSDWIARNAKVADPLLGNAKVQKAIFSPDVLQKKHNSEPVDIGNNTIVVVRVAEHRPEHEQTLEEVKLQIRAELIAQEGAKLAEAKGKEWLRQLKEGKQVAELHWADLGELSRRAPAGLGLSEARAVFSAPVTKLPAYVGVKRENGAYAVFTITGVKQPKVSDDEQRGQLRSLLSEVNANAQVSSYLDLLREKYKVMVNRQAAE
jgi:peptidyl-prolyl cis-trans isomerase D